MRVDKFDFHLPEELIALRPARPRRSARMLLARGDGREDRRVEDLPRLLRPGDMLVFNDTKVIPARLTGERRRAGAAPGEGVARIEATLIRRDAPDLWQALVRPAKRLRAGDVIAFDGLSAEAAADPQGGRVPLRFDRSGADLDAAVAAAGVMPLPPYIAGKRPADAADHDDYQTVFAEKPGAVAAPTASLHFDDVLVKALRDAGIRSARLTLHVGAGTFRPVTAETTDAHVMHSEWGEVSEETAETLNAARAEGARILPVGTTALRLLESAAGEDGRLAPWRGETDIFITPGHRFRICDGLMTNFHLPRSTLMMLVSALMGVERVRAIYAHAIAGRYRFYSYGDSSLLLPKG
ncbi:MAG: tRNA preQ1(34) S-adenosylmethionine ribosyltransferase-isomerase QueA [Pseudomonadota bacterium]